MNNTVTLYNVPYTLGGVAQPHFTTESARTNFFANITNRYEFTENYNINLQYNLEFELKLALDISIIDGFNFVIVDYNSRKYYAYIVDYEQISVNRTRILCKRSIFFEVVDTLSYFNDYNVEKISMQTPNFSPENGLLFPSLRYKNKSFDSSISVGYKTFDNLTFLNTAAERTISGLCNNTINVTIIICGNIPNVSAYAFYQKLPTNFFVYVLPHDNIDVVKRDGSVTRLYALNRQNYVKTLNKFSPYILNMYEVSIPTYQSYLFGYGQVTNFTDDNIKFFELHYVGDPYTLVFSKDKIDKYAKYNLYFMSPENEYSFYGYQVIGNGDLTIYIYFMIGNFELAINIIPPNGAILPYQKLCFKTNGSAIYVRDQKNVFTSENKYYDALSAIRIKESWQSGVTTAFSELAVGGIQSAMGSTVLGASNITRSVFSLIDANIKSDNAVKREKYSKLQEQEKPSDGFISSNFQTNIQLFNGFAYKIEIPFDSDISEYEHELQNYGADCILFFEDVIPYNKYLVDGHFFIKSTCKVKHKNNQLTVPYISDFLENINRGILFYVY